MGNLASPGLKAFFKLAKVTSWTGAAGGAYGGWTLGTMAVAGIFGKVVAVGAAAIGVVAGAAAGFGIAIPIAIGAVFARNAAKKLYRTVTGQKPPQPPAIPVATPVVAPASTVVNQSLDEVKSVAQEFNAEAAVELADDLTFRKLKLNMGSKKPAEPTQQP